MPAAIDFMKVCFGRKKISEIFFIIIFVEQSSTTKECTRHPTPPNLETIVSIARTRPICTQLLTVQN
jgi:hypothetical protein